MTTTPVPLASQTLRGSLCVAAMVALLLAVAGEARAQPLQPAAADDEPSSRTDDDAPSPTTDTQLSVCDEEVEATAFNAVYLELAGPGLLYSLNYERRLELPIAFRAGLTLFGVAESGTGRSMDLFIMPLTASYLLGWGSHHIEMGAGLSWGYASSDLNNREGEHDDFWLITALFQTGYRYQPPEGGFVFRATFTPFYGGERFAPLGSPFQLWGSLSAGYAF